VKLALASSMFCLRSWIPILFFLTNASPIYLVLFISATYILNRPCVYCSLLLAVLVISLFDFNSSWYEPRYTQSNPLFTMPNPPSKGTSMVPAAVMDTLELVGSVVNSTAASVVGSVVGSLKLRNASAITNNNSAVLEWVKSLLRKEWRISCFDVVLRL